MILNGVIALILRSSPNSIALLTDYVTVVEARLTISVKYCLWVPVFHFRTKLMYPAARSLCDSWASCQSHHRYDWKWLKRPVVSVSSVSVYPCAAYGRDVSAHVEAPLEQEPTHPGRNTVTYEARQLKALLQQLMWRNVCSQLTWISSHGTSTSLSLT